MNNRIRLTGAEQITLLVKFSHKSWKNYFAYFKKYRKLHGENWYKSWVEDGKRLQKLERKLHLYNIARESKKHLKAGISWARGWSKQPICDKIHFSLVITVNATEP